MKKKKQILKIVVLTTKKDLLMPRTMLTDELWSRLLPIMLENGIYDKLNLRNTVEGILYRMSTGNSWRDTPSKFGSLGVGILSTVGLMTGL